MFCVFFFDFHADTSVKMAQMNANYTHKNERKEKKTPSQQVSDAVVVVVAGSLRFVWKTSNVSIIARMRVFGL